MHTISLPTIVDDDELSLLEQPTNSEMKVISTYNFFSSSSILALDIRCPAVLIEISREFTN